MVHKTYNSKLLLYLPAKLNHLKKIRVGVVSYLNTKPLLYGIRNHAVFQEIEIQEDYPSRIADKLIRNELDLGLIPVAAVLRMKDWEIISNYCIGSDGPVASVCLLSEVPVDEIEKVLLDYQSKTSISLAKVLLKEYWKKEVEFIDATGEGFREQIKGTTAGVVIGDRAFQQRLHSTYIYDLGEAWQKHTGLPFVFAAWIANKKLPEDFIKRFDEANGLGLNQIDEVVAENPYTLFDLKEYYTSCISYVLDEEKKKGLKLFLEKLQQL